MVLADCRLARPLEVSGSDELRDLSEALNGMQATLEETVFELRETALLVDREAKEVMQTSVEQTQLSSEQSDSLQQAAARISQIAGFSDEAKARAHSVIAMSERSEAVTDDGLKTVHQAMDGMRELADHVSAIAKSISDLMERSMRIGEIMTTVDDLADSAGLLAMNASLEAARAGEHGRGFWVVAREMKVLAEQTKIATHRVRSILSEVERGTRASVAVTDEGCERAHSAITLASSAGVSIERLTEVINEISSAARTIASSTQEQAAGVEEVASTITHLSVANASVLDRTKRVEQTATHLKTITQKLSEISNRYRSSS